MTEKELKECNEKLKDIASLSMNWNDNGALPIPKNIINNVNIFLKYSLYKPEIFPVACESIQLEYEKENGEYLELEFKENKIEIFRIYEDKTEEEIEYDFNDFYKVLNLVKIFYNGKPENIVLFTGAFNPPTIAHYHMVHSVLRNENKKFNYVVFALSNDKFLSKKQNRNKDWYFNETERLNLVLSMIAHNPNALLFGIEQGYTYEVLCEVKKEFNSTDTYFACGSDKLNEINRWGFHDKLLKEFCFYILLRGTDDETEVNDKCKELFLNTKYVIAKDNEKYKDISATQVRRKIDKKEDFSLLLEKHVYEYLKGVYEWL